MRKSLAPHKEWIELDEKVQNNSLMMRLSARQPLDEKDSDKYMNYLKKVNELSHADDDKFFDRNERCKKLTPYEKVLDDIFDTERRHIIDKKHIYLKYPSANMFYNVIKNIEQTSAYKLMRKLPKGGNLHIHTSSSWDAEEMLNFLKNDFLHKENVYVYRGERIPPFDPNVKTKPIFIEGQLLYLTDKKAISKFESEHPGSRIVPLSEIDIENELKFITFSDSERMSEVDYIWDEFGDVFTRVYSILSVREVYREYYYHTFETLYADNIDYCELRFGLTSFCESNDSIFSKISTHKTENTANVANVLSMENIEVDESIAVIYDLYKKFQKVHPDFKLKLIISTSRSSKPNDEVVKLMQKAQIWRETFKDEGNDFIVGFDFVSEEDLNYKTDCYAKIILDNDINIPFYFHDGESNWADDDNVVAAVCLDTKRIGHGFNLYRFPAVLDEVVKRDICLEICPISNQLLRYSPDLRSHPMGEYIKRGVPFVICSDDPQIFNDKGLSYDFWEFYYSQLVDLVSIKQAIRNSYSYSAMSKDEKEEAIRNWEDKWHKSVKKLVENNPLGCAAMLDKYCYNCNDDKCTFTLNEDDMYMWTNYYMKLLKDKNICNELVDKCSDGTFNKEDCVKITESIYSCLKPKDTKDQVSCALKLNKMQDIGFNAINDDSQETSYEDAKAEFFNMAWK